MTNHVLRYFFFAILQRHSLSFPFTIGMAATALMPSISETLCVPSTWTQLWNSSAKWVEPRNAVRSELSSTNSSPSTPRSRRRRTWDATRISLNVWSCTTRKKTAPCCWLNCNTVYSLWVWRIGLENYRFVFINSILSYNRWEVDRWGAWKCLQGLHGPRGRWR